MMLFKPWLVAPMTRGQFRWTSALVAFASGALLLCVWTLVPEVRDRRWGWVAVQVACIGVDLLVIAWNGTALRLRHTIIPWRAHLRLHASCPSSPCASCGHPVPTHRVIATTGDPRQGGIVLCPEFGCRCYAEWALGIDESPAFVPDPDQVDSFRAFMQDRVRRNREGPPMST